MKTLLFLLLALTASASPYWIPAGFTPDNLVRLKLNSPTKSMAPALQGNEFIWVEIYTGKQAIAVGDFVCFLRHDGLLVLHRVTAKNKRAIYTSGDANRFSDGWTLNKNIRYIVRFVERPTIK